MELFAGTILFGSGWLAESVYSMKSPCSRKVLAVIPATVHSTYDSLGYQIDYFLYKNYLFQGLSVPMVLRFSRFTLHKNNTTK